MGNNSLKPDPTQTIEQTVDSLLSSSEPTSLTSIAQHLINFLALFKKQLPCRMRSIESEGDTKHELRVSEAMVRIFHHPFFREKMLVLIRLLIKKLNHMMTKKTMLLITCKEWQETALLADFIVIFIDDRMRNLCDSLKFRNDIEQNSKKYAANQTNIPILLHELQEIQREEFAQTLKDVLYYSFRMKDSLISRSPQTQSKVDALLPSLFLIYIKLYAESKEQFRLKFSHDEEKQNIYICVNMVGLGLEHKKQILVDLANTLLYNILIKSDFDPHSLPSIPSHFYQHLPVFHCKNIYESLATLNLYALTEINKQTTSDAHAKYTYLYKINRIQALRVVFIAVNFYQATCSQIVYYSNFLWAKINSNRLQKYFIYRLGKAFRSHQIVTPALDKYLNAVEKRKIAEEQQGNSKQIQQMMRDEQDVVTQVDSVTMNPLPMIEALSQKFIYEKICRLPTRVDESDKYLLSIIKMEGNHEFIEKVEEVKELEQNSQNILSSKKWVENFMPTQEYFIQN